jgi:Protein of unknown function (DUF3551)
MMRLLLLAAVLAGACSIGTSAHAQDYPWCSNFADGAGTNCGFPTLEQCKATIAGSGGYCDQNTQSKTPLGPTPERRQERKHHPRKHS